MNIDVLRSSPVTSPLKADVQGIWYVNCISGPSVNDDGNVRPMVI